jgi:hypothetical protein
VNDRGKVIAERAPTELKARFGATVIELGYADRLDDASRATKR